ncbi:alpha/beta hydrolase family protein [Streptomyces sp. NPDC056708]|uniref:alpha/beta hydrolase family protein n=1 Tax=unclassified Streptomyces TaxID=2593676 RepID=UPI0036978C25
MTAVLRAPVLRVPGILSAAVLLAAVSLTGCGGGDGDGGAGADGRGGRSATDAAVPDDFGCLTSEEAKAASLTFKSADGTGTGAYAPGGASDGRTGAGIVLAHQSDGTACQWKDKADELHRAGYRVLAVNSAGQEVSEIVGAAGYLRGKGAKRLLLMGASKGGTAVLTAAPAIRPQPDAVIALSAPTVYSAMNALDAVPKLTAPVLYMAAEYDESFGEDAKALNKASTNASEHKLIYVRGAGEHGVALLDSVKNWATVQAFLKKYGS